jgi:nitrite reductase/ring-hydroxylating ferredoxin subunit/uncharacterized membrane protein
MSSHRPNRLAHALDGVEDWQALDRVAAPLRTAVAPLTARRPVRNVLSGVPIGHALHPSLAQLTVGCFLGAGLLDLRGRRSDRGASTALIASGVAAALPTALTGLTDWSHGHEQQQRTGLVHAAGNGTALALYAATLLRRRRGGSGRLLSVAALTVSGAAAYLGGHLAFRQALGPNHAEHVPHRVPPGWASLGPLDEIPERTLVPRTLGDQPLVAYRDGAEVVVLSDVCPHLSGPLHEGEVADGCVTCPWHGSSFRLADGEPVAGPATAPVPAFEVRVESGQVRVLLPGAG